jgi:hypothetical protein
MNYQRSTFKANHELDRMVRVALQFELTLSVAFAD